MVDLLSTKSDQLLSDNEAGHGNVVLSSPRSSFRGSIRDKLFSYARSSDFKELIGCCCFPAAAICLKNLKLLPRQRAIPALYLQNSGEYIVNQVNNEQYVGETVPGSALYALAVFLPLTIQLWASLSGAQKDLHKTGCVYLTAVGLTLFITDSIKLYVGYLRPVFFNKCQPDEKFESCSIDDDRGIRVSFPSGHSSLMFCGMLLLSFYLERKFGASRLRSLRVDSLSGRVVMEHTSKPGLHRFYSVFCFSPVLLAIFVASSRLVDNMHFPADVVGGAILGGSIAAMVQSIWFPTLPTMEDDC